MHDNAEIISLVSFTDVMLYHVGRGVTEATEYMYLIWAAVSCLAECIVVKLRKNASVSFVDNGLRLDATSSVQNLWLNDGTLSIQWRHLSSIASRIIGNRFFFRQLFRSNKKISKLYITGPLKGPSIGYRWIPLTFKVLAIRQVFPCHDVILWPVSPSALSRSYVIMRRWSSSIMRCRQFSVKCLLER